LQIYSFSNQSIEYSLVLWTNLRLAHSARNGTSCHLNQSRLGERATKLCSNLYW